MVNIKNKIESIKDFITHPLFIYSIIFYTFISTGLNVSTNLWNEYIVYPSVREEYVEIVGKPLEKRRQYFKKCFEKKNYPSEHLENLEFRIHLSATEKPFYDPPIIYKCKRNGEETKKMEIPKTNLEKEVRNLKEKIEYELSRYPNTYY